MKGLATRGLCDYLQRGGGTWGGEDEREKGVEGVNDVGEGRGQKRGGLDDDEEGGGRRGKGLI